MKCLLPRAAPVRLFAFLLLVSVVGSVSLHPAWAARIARADGRAYQHAVAIALSGPGIGSVRAKAFTLEGPRRLVLDLADTVVASGVPAGFSVRSPGLTQVRMRQFRADPDVVRLVFTLAGGAPVPRWRLISTAEDSALLLLQPPGPVTLAAPTVERKKQAWLVRLPGVGYLERRTGALENPTRVFLDFTNAEVPASSGRNIAAGPIRQVRMGQQAPSGEEPVARVAIELRSSQAFAEQVDGVDLVLAFTQGPVSEAVLAEPPRTSGTYDVPRDPGTYDVPADPGTYDVPAPPTPVLSALTGRRIAVDPGHGGKDTGTLWSDGTETIYEADVVLAIGQCLAELLRKAGAEVLLTRREGDPRISLADRVRFATDFRAEAYVSLHCDSCALPSETASGTTVYYGRDGSAALAQVVKEEVVTELGTRDRGIEKHPAYYVVRMPECPAILVETAYINNEADRALLTDTEAQGRIAKAIARGIARFLASKGTGATQ